MPTKKAHFLKEALRSCNKAFTYVALFSCVVNILMLTVSVYMLQIFDRVFASHNSDTLIYLTIIAIFAIAILSVLDFIRARVLLYVSQWLDKKLSSEALNRSIDNILQGQVYGAQSLRDVGTIRGFLSGYGILAMMDTPWVPIYLFVIFLLDPWLGLIGVIGAIILFALAILNELATREMAANINTNSMKTQHHISSALRNAESIQAMGMMPEITRRWFLDNDLLLKLQTKMTGRSGTILAVSKFFRLTVQILMLGIGAYLVVSNRLTSGAMIAASIILGRALAPIEQSMTGWNQFMNARQAYRRLDEYYQLPKVRTVQIELPRPNGHLTVENVSYTPPGIISYILRNIEFDLMPSEILAIIGPSGAGKTTLARLIVGAWRPTFGIIRLDEADIFTWDRASVGKYIGYLPQSVELFAGTVKENIARFTDADDAQIIEAGKYAGVHDMILRLPNGYDTVIGEAMMNLSAGQRQRIGLARALFGNPQLVVLDEPNSNLDAEGEFSLIKALQDAKLRGVTLIFIAHKPNVVQISDKILYLHEGVMKAFGASQEILNKLREAPQPSQAPQAQARADTGSVADTSSGSDLGSGADPDSGDPMPIKDTKNE